MISIAELTRQGQERFLDITEQVGRKIEFNWKGNLREGQESLKGDIDTSRDQEAVYVYSRNKALKFLEFGTDPHKIVAKNSQFLSFDWPDAPAPVRRMFEGTFPTVFFKSVQHPGIKPQAHLRRGISKTRSEV